MRRILSAGEKFSRKKKKSCDLIFFKNTKFSLKCVFVPLLGVADRNEFRLFITSGCLYAFMKKQILPNAACLPDRA